ncbi:hypothetical protein C8Q76DRAFT_709027 [Earliella scabrosa]|nr:hypothetical protein C8Q76DRAFT_709027 [Earliella scabrosa]
MESTDNTQYVRIWHCNWDWCSETFRERTKLMDHLHANHYKNILKVKKRDWDAYLRSTEGQSGATVSFGLTYPSSRSSSPQYSQGSNPDPIQPDLSNEPAAVPDQLQLPATPSPRIPPLPRNLRARGSGSTSTSPPETQAHSQPTDHKRSPMAPPEPPLPSSVGDHSPVKRRRKSFAAYTAQSSPMSTPSVSSMPPSPALSNMITDAINRAGQINSQSPYTRSPLSRGSGVKSRPLPRRTSMGESPTPSQSQNPSALGPARTSPTRPRASASSPGSTSVGSAQAVEDALTQSISEQQSYCGSHAVESHPTYLAATDSDTGTQALHSPAQPHSQSQAGSSQASASQLKIGAEAEPSSSAEGSAPASKPIPPLPRTRQLRSRTPATSAAPAPTTTTTRTLRSRSKTPAPASTSQTQETQSLPVPQRTRSRASSATSNPGTAASTSQDEGTAKGTKGAKGRRTGSKPPSTRRAGSKPPAGANADAKRGGLAAVPEQPDDDASVEQTHIKRAPQTREDQPALPKGTQTAFRSGTLQLPRRTRTAPQSQSQAGSQSQPGIRQSRSLPQKKTVAGQADLAVKREPDADVDAMDVDPSESVPHTQAQSGSGSEGGYVYREGHGFDLRGIQLMTQRPYPSQSQSHGDWDGASP